VVPEEFNTTFVEAAPFNEYDTVALAVPVIVNIAFDPEQIGEFDVSAVTFGNAKTVTFSLFVREVEHAPLLT
jgi:hypothetical protein